MNTKVSLVIVVAVLAHTSFYTLCDGYSLWGLFDSSEKTSAEVEAENKLETEPLAKPVAPPTAPSATVQSTASATTVVSDTKDTSAGDTSRKTSSGENTGRKNSSGERFNVRPYLQNAGIARAPIGFLAGLAKIGTDGLKSVVQTSTGLGSTTIDQASLLRDRVIDSTQNAIEMGTQKSLDNIVPMMSKMDTYRRSFSGGTKTNPDKAHSITITTSSDAPINSMYSFAKDYMPAGAAGSSALPPITSIDFSKFLR